MRYGAAGEQLYVPSLTSPLIQIPRAPSNARGVRIYRTKNLYAKTLSAVDDRENIDMGAMPHHWTAREPTGKFYFHSQYAGTAPLDVVDTKADGQLGSAFNLDALGVIPTSAKYISLFKGTMFLAGTSEYPDRIFYSQPLMIEQFPRQNFLQIGDRDSGAVMGMYASKNALVVFKRRGVYLIKGDPLVGFKSETLTEDIGCTSPNAILECPGPELKNFSGKPMGVIFLSDNGPYMLQGTMEPTGTPTSLAFLGNSIRKTWDTTNRAALIGACAAINYEDEEVWFQVPANGSVAPNLGLVYHYGIDQWSVRDGYTALSMCTVHGATPTVAIARYEASGSKGVTLYSHGYGEGIDASSKTTGDKFVAFPGSTYDTNLLDFQERTHVNSIWLRTMNTGAQLQLQYRQDGATAWTDAESVRCDDGERQLNTWRESTLPATLEKTSWITVPIHLQKANQTALQLRVGATRIHFINYEFHVASKRKGTSNIKPLRPTSMGKKVS